MLPSTVDSPVAEPEAVLITSQRLLARRETPAVSQLCCTLSLGPSRRTEIHPDNIAEKQTCHGFHIVRSSAPDMSELLQSTTIETILHVGFVLPCRVFQVAFSPVGLLPVMTQKKNVSGFGKM